MARVEYLEVVTGWGWGPPINKKYVVSVKKGDQVIQEIKTDIKCEKQSGNATKALQSVLPSLGRQGWELTATDYSVADVGYCLCRATLSRRVE